MPGISAMTMTAGPVPATYTRFVSPRNASSRRSKSSIASRSVSCGVALA